MFTLAEANELLPHLERGATLARAHVVRAEAIRAELVRTLEHASEGDITAVEREKPELVAELYEVESDIRAELGLLHDLGAELLALEPLEVRVLGHRDHLPVLLYYRSGDPGFAAWHSLGEPRELARPIEDSAPFGDRLLPA